MSATNEVNPAQSAALSNLLCRWVARYEFAGATGSCGGKDTRMEAEKDADKIYEHYLGIANVWIEEIST